MQRMIQITAILLVCVGLLVSVLFATGVGTFSDDEDQFADCRTSAVAGGSAAIGVAMLPLLSKPFTLPMCAPNMKVTSIFFVPTRVTSIFFVPTPSYSLLCHLLCRWNYLICGVLHVFLS